MVRLLILLAAGSVLSFLVFARLLFGAHRRRSLPEIEEDAFFILALTALLVVLILLPTCALWSVAH